MRTEETINNNITAIHAAMRTIQSQISMLENEYQKTAIEDNGERYEGWDEMKAKLQTGWDTLNQLWHMEADIVATMRADAIERAYEEYLRQQAEIEYEND